MVEVFNFIKVIFLSLIFLLVFSLLSPVVNNSVDNWKNQAWASNYPLLTFLISGANFWIYLGLVIGILAGVIYGTKVWGSNNV